MMNDETPYHTRPPTEIEQERCCLETIFAAAPPANFIFEAFGGVGLAAGIWARKFPRARVESWDLDERCVELYNADPDKHPNARCYRGNSMVAALQLRMERRSWAASLDFNKFTVMDLWGRKSGKWKVDLLRTLVGKGPKWFHITDSAAPYLHLNWKRYGLEERDLAAYVLLLANEVTKLWPDYRLEKWDAHHAASYLLFVRTSVQ